MFPGHKYEFGEWRLDPAEHLLLRNGKPVALTPKVFETLVVLVENAGRLVQKDEFVKRVWPDTFVDDVALAKNISQLRKLIGNGHGPAIETVPKLGYRLLVPVRLVSEAPETNGHVSITETQPSSLKPKVGFAYFRPGRWESLAIGVIALMALALGIWYYVHSRAAASAGPGIHDAIVIADVVNETGDPVFDDALKQALTIQLEQSPFLGVLSEQRVNGALRLMRRENGRPLTVQLAREVCVRTGCKAVVAGSIGHLGRDYVVGLNAFNCGTGDAFVREQAEATSKENVLWVLGVAARNLRARLGESLNSIQAFGTPVEEGTTSSLDALKAFSMGMKIQSQSGDAEAIPFYQRAVELDSTFATAYARLGATYGNLGQPTQARKCLAKAYELRNGVSERERLYITADYAWVNGELEKETQTYLLWVQTFPKDFIPHVGLASNYNALGHYHRSLQESYEALKLEPDSLAAYGNLGVALLALNQPDAVVDLVKRAQARGVDGLREIAYLAAFLRGNFQDMAAQLTWTSGRPGEEDPLLSLQSNTEAYYGRWRNARDVSRRAMDSALRADSKERAALTKANAALREVEFGNQHIATEDAEAALVLNTGRNVKIIAALTLARAGEVARARAIVRELQTENPSNTLLKVYWIPTINAAICLHLGRRMEALELLQTVAPFELGMSEPVGGLYPIYLRGQSFLAAQQGEKAEIEFQKILDHPGIVLNSPLAPLARLGLARSYALQRDSSKAATVYQQFLATWKDADPDIPILKQAKAEYAKLR